MRTLLLAIAFVLFTAGTAWANCTTHSYVNADGRLILCNVCTQPDGSTITIL